MLVPCWLSKANWAVARPVHQRSRRRTWKHRGGNQPYVHDRARVSGRAIARLSFRFLSLGKSKSSSAAWTRRLFLWRGPFSDRMGGSLSDLIPEQARWIAFKIKSERRRAIALLEDSNEDSRA